MKRFLRKLHRWLGLLMALQIAAWMASGLWFALFPIEQIRGEHLTHAAEPLDGARGASGLVGLAAPAVVAQTLDGHLGHGWSLDALALTRRDGELLWRAEGTIDGTSFRRLLRADGGTVLPPLDREAASRRARDLLLQSAEPIDVQWIEQAPADSEVRGRPLPLWLVTFDKPEALHLYLDPWTGEIVARRTTRWRVFDFFWMLHVMDFETRDDFNHPLLQISALAGLLIALSGIVLWALTTRLWRRRSGLRAAP